VSSDLRRVIAYRVAAVPLEMQGLQLQFCSGTTRSGQNPSGIANVGRGKVSVDQDRIVAPGFAHLGVRALPLRREFGLNVCCNKLIF
jgi:hypothetical protein